MKTTDHNTGVKVTFGGRACAVELWRYNNGLPALLLVDDKNGEPVARATVNLPGGAIKANHIFIKSWDENEGLLEVLEAAGVVRRTGQYEPVGQYHTALVEVLIGGGK